MHWLVDGWSAYNEVFGAFSLHFSFSVHTPVLPCFDAPPTPSLRLLIILSDHRSPPSFVYLTSSLRPFSDTHLQHLARNPRAMAPLETSFP